MKREQIQQKFRVAAERAREGSAGERRAAAAALELMIRRYPWLRDYGRLLGLTQISGLTREFPWLAQPSDASAAKTRRIDAPGRVSNDAVVSKDMPKKQKSCARTAWVKPPTPPGFEYRQCYKAKCHCMRGGPWHGPYRYAKRWRQGKVSSEYLGNQIANDVSRET